MLAGTLSSEKLDAQLPLRQAWTESKLTSMAQWERDLNQAFVGETEKPVHRY